jgi:hypothetical protein
MWHSLLANSISYLLESKGVLPTYRFSTASRKTNETIPALLMFNPSLPLPGWLITISSLGPSLRKPTRNNVQGSCSLGVAETTCPILTISSQPVRKTSLIVPQTKPHFHVSMSPCALNDGVDKNMALGIWFSMSIGMSFWYASAMSCIYLQYTIVCKRPWS